MFDMEAYAIQENLYHAWDQWEISSCIERHGGHMWQLELEPFLDYPDVSLNCSYCPASIEDLGCGGSDCIYGEVGVMPIANGQHRSLLPQTIPVRAELIVEHYPANPSHGDEWGIWIEVSNV